MSDVFKKIEGQKERRPSRVTNPTREDIIDAAARAGFVQAWASWMEERGESLRGELMDQAPPTPSKARAWAKKLIQGMETLNGLPVSEMYERALAMPGRHLRRSAPEDFGFTTAMQALGHGVSWADDHPEHGFLIPRADFSMFGPRSFDASVSTSSTTTG